MTDLSKFLVTSKAGKEQELAGIGRSCQEVPKGVRRHQGLSGVRRSW